MNWNLVLAVCFASNLQAQVLVPFVSSVDRAMVFHEKRFVEVDARPPKQFYAMDASLLFQDHDGGLRYFTAESGKTAHVERGIAREVQVAGNRAAWTKHDSLFLLRSGSAYLAATGVEKFRVSDSLVVYLDSLEHELIVVYRGQRIPIAKVEQGTALPQWNQGGNTVTFYDRSRREVSLFQYGRLRALTDSADVGIAVNGMDIVGYWNDVKDEFIGVARTREKRLSGLKPISAQAGNGILAFVDGTLKLKVWDGDEVVQLTDSMPAQYWVKDRLVLYLWAGGLKMWSPSGIVEVEPYVPEHWQVNDDLLVYLDINRELRGIRGGKRLRYGKEASVGGFQLYGDAVLYRSPAGPITIIRDGRTYTF